MGFKFDGSGLKKFCRELDRLPKLIEQAEAMTLNNMAFKFRDEAAGAIIGEFTSRRPDFVKRQFRVQKATTGNMAAIAGSVGANGSQFSGFTEFLGGQDQRQRSPTMTGRGNKASVLPKANRMLPGADFPKIDGDDGGLPITAQLSMLHRQGTAKRFIMGGPEFAAGLYEFEKGKQTERGQPKVRMVQSFKKPKPPRPFDWIAAGLSKITDDFVNGAHIKNLDYLAKKFLKKAFK